MQRNVLVLLQAHHKDFWSRRYDQISAGVIEDWRNLFGTTEPHRGTQVADYIDGIFRDVDEED